MASIQGVYVALFGRPADPTGLAYFNSVTSNGADLSAIGDLASTSEYTTRFKDMTNVQIVNSIYQSLFGRDAESAGLEFFVNALNNGTLTINNIAIAILDGAQGTDATIVANKVASADLYTAALDTAVEIASYSGTAAADAGRTFLKAVTTSVATSATVEASVKSMASAGVTGNTITAAAAAGNHDIKVGTATTDTTDKNDTINAATVATAGTNAADDSWIFGTDKVDGGFGTDTFNVTIDAAAPAAVGTDELKSIEIVKITSTDNATTLDVANAKDTTEFWNSASTLGLQLDNIALGTKVGVTGAVSTASIFNYASATGTSDTATLALDGATGGGTITIASIESVTVDNTGTSSVALALTGAKAVAITGSGSLTFTDAANTTTETIDGSAFSGTLTATLTGDNALKTFTGSAQGDKITVDTDSMANDLTVVGGDGADLITVANGAANSAKTLTLTGGAGSDKFVIAETDTVDDAAEANFAKSLVTITDFDKAADVIDVTALGARETLDQFEQASVAGAASLFAAVTEVAGYTTANGSAVFVYGGDTYIFNDTDGGSDFTTGDALIKVSGVSDLADLTASNFLI